MKSAIRMEDLDGLLGAPFAAPEGVMIEAIRDEMSKWFWFLRDGKETNWACEACGAEGVMSHAGRGKQPIPKHMKEYACPACGRNGTARNEVLSRRGMKEDMLATTWHRGTDGETLIARTWYAVLDRSADAWDCMGDRYYRPWTAEPDVTLWGVCAINGRAHTADRWEREGIQAWTGPYGGWRRRLRWASCMSTAYGRFGGAMGHPIEGVIWNDQLLDALEGTSVGDAWGAIGEDLVVADHSPDWALELGNIARDRQIEYMIKGGFIDLAERAVAGQPELGRWINRRGKTAAAMLRLPAHEIRQARKTGVEIDLDYLQMRRRITDSQTGGAWTPAEISALAEQVDDWRWNWTVSHLSAVMRRKALRWCLRRTRARDGHPGRAFGDLADYWRDSARLGRDLNDEREALPRDLEARHAEDQRRLRHAADPERDKDIARLVPKWERRFGFSYGGLVLRPAYSSRELIDEGETQHICVGGYVGRYAEGETVIMLLRERERLWKPWRTVEISPRTGMVIQDRGYRNDMTPGGIPRETKERLAAFWEAYEKRGKTA